MPNGVICGGAVDGSNQLGGIVTCHAMAARPEGAGPPAPARLAPSETAAPSSSHAKTRGSRAMLQRMFSSQAGDPLRIRKVVVGRASAAACAHGPVLSSDATPAAMRTEDRQEFCPNASRRQGGGL